MATTLTPAVERALKISLILYFPLLILAGADLALDFRPDELGSPLFRCLFYAWLADGSLALVAGIGALRRLWVLGEDRPRTTLILPLLACALGLPPAYILLDLALKFFEFIFA